MKARKITADSVSLPQGQVLSWKLWPRTQNRVVARWGALVAGLVLSFHSFGETFKVEALDLTGFEQEWRTAQKGKNVEGNPLVIAGRMYTNGVGTHATSSLRVILGKNAKSFDAAVGLDDAVGTNGSVTFEVLGDGKPLWKSGVMHGGEPAKLVALNLAGIQELLLLTRDADDGISHDFANWVDASIIMARGKPKAAPPRQPSKGVILTPKPSAKPRINGAKVFGVRPGAPFLFTVAASGQKPLTFKADNLPKGLRLDDSTGRITGAIAERGTFPVAVVVSNALGRAESILRIVVGDTICLTPPLGWNSWYCWSESVSQDSIHAAADAMVSSGLAEHGWTYVNIDDCWQGERGGEYKAIQGNERFPDIKRMCDYLHSRGLKAGIYSTPWMGSYAGYRGGSCFDKDGDYSAHALSSSERPQAGQIFGKFPGTLDREMNRVGTYWFCDADARQWAEWGFDYVKYDWKPNDVPTTLRLAQGLRNCGRDIVLSLSNEAPFENAPALAEQANCWRTTGDIKKHWGSVSRIGFSQARWQPRARPGHWNDPDMLVIGMIGEPNQKNITSFPTKLTPDEQYTQVSLWSLLAAPMLLSCDLTKLDEFTLGLLINDEVIEVNQDPLGRQAQLVSKNGNSEVWAKEMEDGSKALGLFNRGEVEGPVKIKWTDLGLANEQQVRDLWRQKHLGRFRSDFQTTVKPHGVILLRISVL